MENTNSKKKMSSTKRKKNRVRKAFRIVGEILVGIQILATLVFIGFTWRLGVLPAKYVAGFAALLLVFAALLLTMQIVTRGKAIVSKIVSILMSAVLIFGSVYMYQTHDAIEDISGDTLGKQVHSVLVVVRKDDPAEKVWDTKDYVYGVQSIEDDSEMAEAMKKVNADAGKEVLTKEFDTLNDQVAGLLSETVDAIVYDESFSGIIEEVNEGYNSKVKVIAQYSIESKNDNMTQGNSPNVNVKEEPFSMFISGIDVYGPISSKSRSDVNIIATVNPETRQILLTNTPRDFYVTIPGVSGEKKDKLTHAGIYGVDKSIAALEELYEIEIPFYTRVNFTSLITMVDLMGGIDVESEFAFTTSGAGGEIMDVKKGTNHFNGDQALSFARERYNVPGGDNQRGKDQMAVIQAMFKKMITPEMLVKAPKMISEVSNSVETNMSMEQIQRLIQSQIDNGGEWTIKSVAAEGTGDQAHCYSAPGTALYVTVPNETSVANIKVLMDKVENDEMLPSDTPNETGEAVE